MNDIDWKDLEVKTVTTIKLCLADVVMYHVMDEESSVCNLVEIGKSGSDLSQHINVFNHVINDLKRVDVKFEDEDKALMLLNSLPASSTYENLVTTLMWGKETLELEKITSVLLGNIRIKMFDGIVRTLCDVRHVPDLRKNLISLGTLYCNGFSYKSTSGVMKVSKGAMTVMKGSLGEREMMELHKINLLKDVKT
ncbi:Retrovirus-related Pol polyprotein from transposon TNT 1-94 [Vitis vinifera]|uniref:Retrovirus-related Pol polyprotein from transposon TNT 1-94 n=1 Tax=Vitis vinifera TaxID=29760 RepID=A0A438BRR9_VITVI|nr:Retrovirus-related Pol polyprotein from transposon TNT 1-94 [Vitis vinifera]